MAKTGETNPKALGEEYCPASRRTGRSDDPLCFSWWENAEVVNRRVGQL